MTNGQGGFLHAQEFFFRVRIQWPLLNSDNRDCRRLVDSDGMAKQPYGDEALASKEPVGSIDGKAREPGMNGPTHG